MGSFSVWHLLIVLIFLSIYVVPIALILRKAGYSMAWAILSIVPLFGVILLWVLALNKWPIERALSERTIENSSR